MSLHVIPIIVIFTNICLGAFVYSQGPGNTSNKIFSLLCFFAALWNASNFFADTFVSIFWLQTTFAIGAIFISIGLVWVHIVSGTPARHKKIHMIILFGLLFALISYTPNLIARSISETSSSNVFYGSLGWGLFLYAIYYFTYCFLIIKKLIETRRNNSNQRNRTQITNILIGTIIVLVVITITSFVAPYFFSLFISSTFDSLGLLIFLIFLTYTIVKYHFFNIKIIAIEIATFSLWTIILGKLLLSKTSDELLLTTSLLAISIIFGILIIRSTLHEIEQREHIEKLTSNLQTAYKTIGEKDPPNRATP